MVPLTESRKTKNKTDLDLCARWMLVIPVTEGRFAMFVRDPRGSVNEAFGNGVYKQKV